VPIICFPVAVAGFQKFRVQARLSNACASKATASLSDRLKDVGEYAGGMRTFPQVVRRKALPDRRLTCSMLLVESVQMLRKRWPMFMVGYMLVLAYVASLIVFQGGRLLGFS
jgi:hypothetical protein